MLTTFRRKPSHLLNSESSRRHFRYQREELIVKTGLEIEKNTVFDVFTQFRRNQELRDTKKIWNGGLNKKNTP